MPQPVAAVPPTPPLDERREIAQHLRLFGQRMVEARHMAGIGQMDAARAFGYANSGVLSRVENGYFSDR